MILPQPTFDQRLEILLEHLKYIVEHKGERRGVLEFRKYYSGYLRMIPGVAKLRAELMQYVEHQPIVEHLRRFGELCSTQEASELAAV